MSYKPPVPTRLVSAQPTDSTRRWLLACLPARLRCLLNSMTDSLFACELHVFWVPLWRLTLCLWRRLRVAFLGTNHLLCACELHELLACPSKQTERSNPTTWSTYNDLLLPTYIFSNKPSPGRTTTCWAWLDLTDWLYACVSVVDARMLGGAWSTWSACLLASDACDACSCGLHSSYVRLDALGLSL